MAQPRWNFPAPSYDKDINEIVRIYKNAIDEVVLSLESLSTFGKDNEITRKQMNSIIAQMGVLLSEVDNEARVWVEERVRRAFIDGQAETLVALKEASTLQEARSMVQGATMSALIKETIDVIIEDTFEDLLYANQKMKRETVKMVRSVVSEQMKMKAVQGMGRNTTRKGIVEALTKKELRKRFDVEGNIAIVDRAGRRWKLETYAEMVTRTKMLQAHVEGTRVEALERDVDLAIISSHGATDACRFFEGQVISMNGLTKGFPTYEELMRSNLIFHPNCRHKITPIRDINLLPTEVRKKFEDGQDTAKSVLSDSKRKK